MTPLGVKGHISVRVRVGILNLIMEQIKPYITVCAKLFSSYQLVALITCLPPLPRSSTLVNYAERPNHSLLSTRWPDVPIATAGAVAIVIARIVYICGGGWRGVASACIVQAYGLDKKHT